MCSSAVALGIGRRGDGHRSGEEHFSSRRGDGNRSEESQCGGKGGTADNEGGGATLLLRVSKVVGAESAGFSAGGESFVVLLLTGLFQLAASLFLALVLSVFEPLRFNLLVGIHLGLLDGLSRFVEAGAFLPARLSSGQTFRSFIVITFGSNFLRGKLAV